MLTSRSAVAMPLDTARILRTEHSGSDIALQVGPLSKWYGLVKQSFLSELSTMKNIEEYYLNEKHERIRNPVIGPYFHPLLTCNDKMELNSCPPSPPVQKKPSSTVYIMSPRSIENEVESGNLELCKTIVCFLLFLAFLTSTIVFLGGLFRENYVHRIRSDPFTRPRTTDGGDNSGQISGADLHKALSEMNMKFQYIYEQFHSLGLPPKNLSKSEAIHNNDSYTRNIINRLSIYEPTFPDFTEYLEYFKYIYDIYYTVPRSQLYHSSENGTKSKNAESRNFSLHPRGKNALIFPNMTSTESGREFALLFILLNKTAFLPGYSEEETRSRLMSNFTFLNSDTFSKDDTYEESDEIVIKLEPEDKRNASNLDNIHEVLSLLPILKNPESFPSASALKDQERSKVRRIAERNEPELSKRLLDDLKTIDENTSQESSTENQVPTCLNKGETCICTQSSDDASEGKSLLDVDTFSPKEEKDIPTLISSDRSIKELSSAEQPNGEKINSTYSPNKHDLGNSESFIEDTNATEESKISEYVGEGNQFMSPFQLMQMIINGNEKQNSSNSSFEESDTAESHTSISYSTSLSMEDNNSEAIKSHDNEGNSERQGRMYDNKNEYGLMHSRDNQNHPQKQQGQLENNNKPFEITHTFDNANYSENEGERLEENKDILGIPDEPVNVNDTQELLVQLLEAVKTGEPEGFDGNSSAMGSSSPESTVAEGEETIGTEKFGLGFSRVDSEMQNEQGLKETMQNIAAITQNISRDVEIISTSSESATFSTMSEYNSSEKRNEAISGDELDSDAEESAVQGYWVPLPGQSKLGDYEEDESSKDMGIEEDEQAFDSGVVDEEDAVEIPEQLNFEELLQQFGSQGHPEQFSSQERPQQFGSQELPQQFGSQELPQQFGSEELPQQFGSEELPQQVGSEELPQQFGSEELPQQFGSQVLPQQYGSEELPQQFGSEERPQQNSPQGRSYQFGSKVLPQQFGSQEYSQQLDSEALSQQYGSQVLPQQDSPQILPQQFDPEVLSEQYSPQILPQQYGPQDLQGQYDSQVLPQQSGSQNLPQQKGEQGFRQQVGPQKFPLESDSYQLPPQTDSELRQNFEQGSSLTKRHESAPPDGRFVDYPHNRNRQFDRADFTGRSFRGKRQLIAEEKKNYLCKTRKSETHNEIGTLPHSASSENSDKANVNRPQEHEKEIGVGRKQKRSPEVKNNVWRGNMFVWKLDKTGPNEQKSRNSHLLEALIYDLEEKSMKQKNGQLIRWKRNNHHVAKDFLNAKEKKNQKWSQESVKDYSKDSTDISDGPFWRRKRRVLRADLKDLRNAAVNTTFESSVSRMFSDGSGLDILETMMNPQYGRAGEEV